MDNQTLSAIEEMDIINISDYGDALRSSGYKNIESAMAEVVDNAIEAESKEILVVIQDKIPTNGKKPQVYEIAFIDNGTGMSPEWVQKSLRFGSGTKQSKKGIGRFGVGLPQSSMYACPRVEVYSWQNGFENTYMSVLDINLVNTGVQKKIAPAQKAEIPEGYKKYFSNSITICEEKMSFIESGTLILWKNCDNVDPRTVTPLFKRLELSFGQKYRYLIKDGQTKIFLVHDKKDHLNKLVLPNDPLFLMENNILLGNLNDVESCSLRTRGENFVPVFEPFVGIKHPDGVMPVEIKYFDRKEQAIKTGIVTLKFSVVKTCFYDQDHMTCLNPGGSDLGKFVARLEGISVVRENREIDFGEFDFYSDKNSPQHRWWGCEISFGRELDQVFKVANNKQHVELLEIDSTEYEDDEVKPVWLQLEQIITDTIANMKKRNATVRKESRTPNASATNPAEEAITKADEEEAPVTTETDEIRQTKTEEELAESAKEILNERGNEEPTSEDVEEILLQSVIIREKAKGDSIALFDFSKDSGLCICDLNTEHIYYETYVEKMDESAKNAFRLLVASFVRALNEAQNDKRNSYRALMHDWNYKMSRYIRTYLGKD